MKKKLIIFDCLNCDYELYKHIYKKIAKDNGFDLDMVYIWHENGTGHILKSSKDIYALYENTYFLINMNRIDWFINYFNHKKINPENCCFFEYYTTLWDVNENPILAVSSIGVKKNEIYSISSKVPSKRYEHELNNILKDFLNEKRKK